MLPGGILFMRLFFLVIKQTVAEALEFRICDLCPKFLADTLVFGGLLEPAGAVAVLGLQALFDHGDDGGVGIELDFGHGDFSLPGDLGMLAHGERGDDLICDGHEAVVVSGFAHLFPQLVGALKKGDQVVPVVLHAINGVALAFKNGTVGVAELVEECFQGFAVGAAREHARVRHQAPADHDGLHRGESCGNFPGISQGIDVAVVADGEGGVLHSLGEGFQVAVALVEGLADPGVDGQLLHRVIPVDLKDFLPVFRVIDADAGLQGHRDRGFGVDGGEKLVQGVNVRQHTAALALADHGARGTAQVDVDFVITTVVADLNGPEHILYILAQKLGHGGKVHTVSLRQFPGLSVCQAAVDGGGDEGHEVAVHAGEIFVMKPPEGGVGDALQGRIVVSHQTSKYPFRTKRVLVTPSMWLRS